MHEMSPIPRDMFFEEESAVDSKWEKIYLKWRDNDIMYNDKNVKTSPSRGGLLLLRSHPHMMFPQTMQSIENYPDEIRLAIFSRLDAGGYIPEHNGPPRGEVMRIRLGLITPLLLLLSC